MKKIHLLAAAVLFLVSLPMFAQEKTPDLPDVFVKTVPVMKVYTHELGYKILFIKSNQDVGAMYVPIKWFGRATGKGATVFELNDVSPYVSIYWKDGKFEHIVLHVPADPNSRVWGILTTNEDMKPVFNIEEPALSF
jgi:hypothetical protein